MSRQRQNFGAVGQVTRAMVVVSASWRMVIFLRSNSESGWPHVWQVVSPASSVQGCQRTGFLRVLDGRADALGQFGNVGLAQGGDGNGVVRLIHGHGFERRVLGQGLRDGPRQALPRVWFAQGVRLGRNAHRSFPRSQYCHALARNANKTTSPRDVALPFGPLIRLIGLPG